MGERNANVARTPPLAPDRKAALTTKTTETDTDELLDRINVDARAASYVRSTFGWGDAHNVRRAVLQTATWIKELPNAQPVFAVREGRVRSDRHRVRPDRRRHRRGAHHGSSVAALKYSLILIAAILSAATLTSACWLHPPRSIASMISTRTPSNPPSTSCAPRFRASSSTFPTCGRRGPSAPWSAPTRS